MSTDPENQFAFRKLSDEDDGRYRNPRIETEELRWVLDAKVRTLAALVSLQACGKGDDVTKVNLHVLVRQIVALGQKS